MKKKELEIATTTYTVAYKKGYSQCQEDMADKKYTKEDMLKSFWAGVDCEAENGKNFEQFINSLNKQDNEK